MQVLLRLGACTQRDAFFTTNRASSVSRAPRGRVRGTNQARNAHAPNVWCCLLLEPRALPFPYLGQCSLHSETSRPVSQWECCYLAHSLIKHLACRYDQLIVGKAEIALGFYVFHGEVRHVPLIGVAVGKARTSVGTTSDGGKFQTEISSQNSSFADITVFYG